jgi:hypothetical protein
MYWVVGSIMLLSREDGDLDLETYVLVDTIFHHQLKVNVFHIF